MSRNQLPLTALLCVVAACSQTIESAWAADNLSPTKDLHDRARKAMEQGKLPEAIQLEEQAAILSPKDATSYRNLTGLYLDAGYKDKALSEALKAVSVNPSDPFCHLTLGTIYRMANKKEEAIAEFNKAASLSGKDKKIAVNAEVTASQVMAESGQVPQAIKKLEGLNKKYGDDKDVLLTISKIQLATGNKAKSDANLQKILAQDPKYYPALFFLAQQAAGTHDKAKSKEAAQKLVQADPHNPLGYIFSAGVAKEILEDPQQGRNVLQQAITNMGNDPKLFVLLFQTFTHPPSDILGAPSQSDRDKWINLAQDSVKQTIKINPNDFGANIILARMYIAQKHSQDAIPYLQKACQLDPKNDMSKELLRKAEKDKGDFASGIKDWLNSLFGNH